MLERGDIVVVAGGTYTSKPRPVLIMQNQKFLTGESVVVIPFTSADNAEITTRIAVAPSDENGLDRHCFLEVDKMSAINRSYVGAHIGKLGRTTLEEVSVMAIELLSS